MGLVPEENINAIVQESESKINMIIAQMSALMNDNFAKAESISSQNWFRRMIFTVMGQNNAKLEEIRENHDRLNAYMCEVISELYRRNCIDERIIISLGNQLNEIYAGNVQLKNMLGAFALKLNKKIESVDNFNMLVKEIEQGIYSSGIQAAEIIRIISQYDAGILRDKRKLGILKRTMFSKGIITDERINIAFLMMSMTEIPDDITGQIYLELETLRNNFAAKVMLEVIEGYNNLPEMSRRIKRKSAIINGIIEANDIDDSVMLSLSEIYDALLNIKIESVNNSESLKQISEIPDDKPEIEPEIKHEYISDPFDDIRNLCMTFRKNNTGMKLDDMNESLFSNLGIPMTANEIYLSHDDSLFKRGTAGFAVAGTGIYCKKNMFSPAQYISFGELSSARNNITFNEDNVYVRGTIAAFYNGIKYTGALRDLLVNIADILIRHGF